MHYHQKVTNIEQYLHASVLALPSHFHYSGDIQRKTRGVLVDMHSYAPIYSACIEIGTEYDHKSIGEDLPFDSLAPDILDQAIRVDELAIFGGYFFSHFGHFIHESLTRLWPLVTCEDFHSGKPNIYYFSQWNRLSLSNSSFYASQILDGFGIGPESCIDIDRPILFKNVIIPPQIGGLGCSFDSQTQRHGIDALGITRTFYQSFSVKRALCESEAKPSIGNSQLNKIYVSRSSSSNAGGRYLYEESIERFLESNGFTIYDPTKDCLNDQLDNYSKADDIVFAEGSALYGLLFLPGQALASKRISVILRRKNGKWLPDYLATVNPGLDIVCIDEIALDGLFGPNLWDSYSVVKTREIANSLSAIHKLDNSNIKIERSSEASLMAKLVLDYDSRGLANDIARILEFISFDD